ncbi:MAG: Gfo/Idh/MocA family oxidoreductase, partial [Anaerolineales bacterium]|nr:Gfo/Idh/MocA family oxidoreductase [Anaerolineales bacterium]
MTKEQNYGNPSRRDFISKAAGGVVTASMVTHVAATSPLRSTVTQDGAGANDRIRLGFIGCGMQFQSLIRRFIARKDKANDIEFAAVCDVWEPRAKYAQEQTGAPDIYKDYKEILARPDIDAVVVVVPDHWHFQIASEACRAGKDVYLE